VRRERGKGKVISIQASSVLRYYWRHEYYCCNQCFKRQSRDPLQVRQVNPKQIYVMDIYIPHGLFLLWVSDVLLRLCNMNIRSVVPLLWTFWEGFSKVF